MTLLCCKTLLAHTLPLYLSLATSLSSLSLSLAIYLFRQCHQHYYQHSADGQKDASLVHTKAVEMRKSSKDALHRANDALLFGWAMQQARALRSAAFT